jgi:hypothetical protein
MIPGLCLWTFDGFFMHLRVRYKTHERLFRKSLWQKPLLFRLSSLYFFALILSIAAANIPQCFTEWAIAL